MLIFNLGGTKNQVKWRIPYAMLLLALLIGLSACSKDKVTDNDYMPPGIEKPALYKQIREMITGEGGPYLSAKLPNGDELKYFVRWETPIRYYLTGFENHPEYEKYFEQKIKEMAELTGLDIARHDDIYRKGFKPLSESPDGMMTNAAFFFSEDMKKTYFDPRVSTILGAWGNSSEKESEKWMKRKEKHNYTDGSYISMKYGLSREGYLFYLYLEDLSELSNSKKDINFIRFSIIQGIYNLFKRSVLSTHLLSIQNIGAYRNKTVDLTAFDKAFLKALYSKDIKSDYGAYYVVEKLYEKLKHHDFEKGRQK